MKYYLPAIICAFLILILSTRATVSLPFSWTDLLGADKIGHVLAYGALTFTALWGLFKNQGWPTNKKMIWVICLCIAYGVLMEVLQYSFFPNRYFEVLDILANIIGSIGALYFFVKSYKFFTLKT